MKKSIFMLVILTFLANADYELFKSQTKEIGEVVKTEEVYFGSYKGFGDKLAEGSKTGLQKALFAGIKNGIDAGGINLIIGFLDPFVMSLYADQNYLKVLKVTDKNGDIAFKKTMLIGDKHPSYSDEEIRDLMKKGER